MAGIFKGDVDEGVSGGVLPDAIRPLHLDESNLLRYAFIHDRSQALEDAMAHQPHPCVSVESGLIDLCEAHRLKLIYQNLLNAARALDINHPLDGAASRAAAVKSEYYGALKKMQSAAPSTAFAEPRPAGPSLTDKILAEVKASDERGQPLYKLHATNKINIEMREAFVQNMRHLSKPFTDIDVQLVMQSIPVKNDSAEFGHFVEGDAALDLSPQDRHRRPMLPDDEFKPSEPVFSDSPGGAVGSVRAPAYLPVETLEDHVAPSAKATPPSSELFPSARPTSELGKVQRNWYRQTQADIDNIRTILTAYESHAKSSTHPIRAAQVLRFEAVSHLLGLLARIEASVKTKDHIEEPSGFASERRALFYAYQRLRRVVFATMNEPALIEAKMQELGLGALKKESMHEITSPGRFYERFFGKPYFDQLDRFFTMPEEFAYVCLEKLHQYNYPNKTDTESYEVQRSFIKQATKHITELLSQDGDFTFDEVVGVMATLVAQNRACSNRPQVFLKLKITDSTVYIPWQPAFGEYSGSKSQIMTDPEGFDQFAEKLVDRNLLHTKRGLSCYLPSYLKKPVDAIFESLLTQNDLPPDPDYQVMTQLNGVPSASSVSREPLGSAVYAESPSMTSGKPPHSPPPYFSPATPFKRNCSVDSLDDPFDGFDPTNAM